MKESRLLIIFVVAFSLLLTGCGDPSSQDVVAPALTQEDRIKAIEASNASREAKDIQISMIKNSSRTAPKSK